MRSAYAERKAAGLCVRCGTPAAGGVLCAVHAEHDRLAKEAKRRAEGVEPRRPWTDDRRREADRQAHQRLRARRRKPTPPPETPEERVARLRRYARESYYRNRPARLARSAERVEIRRARLAGAFVEPVSKLVLLEISDGACGACGGDLDPRDFHLGHILSLAGGGEHSYRNTQAEHPACNLSKGNRA